MPYKSIDEMPEHTKKFSTKIRRQMMHVFNSTYNKLIKEGKSIKEAERRAFQAANSVIKKRFGKGQNMSTESHSDYFQYLVQDYLGNLYG